MKASKSNNAIVIKRKKTNNKLRDLSMPTLSSVSKSPFNYKLFRKEIRLSEKTRGKFMILRRNLNNWRNSNTFSITKSKS